LASADLSSLATSGAAILEGNVNAYTRQSFWRAPGRNPVSACRGAICWMQSPPPRDGILIYDHSMAALKDPGAKAGLTSYITN